MTKLLKNAISKLTKYLNENYDKGDIKKINNEIKIITGVSLANNCDSETLYNYKELQNILSDINERESLRKKRGVYYTPIDVVKFILFNSIKLSVGELSPKTFNDREPISLNYATVINKKTIFDPTCGSGEFLLAALQAKMNLLDSINSEISRRQIMKTVGTIHGNDINIESVIITKLRLLLFILHRYGSKKIVGLGDILNESFTHFDYLKTRYANNKFFDIIIGNPPYVEDNKSEFKTEKFYGNIYANILDNAANQLNWNGVIGFVIPLSYISTQRMWKIRRTLFNLVPEQYILSYADRPDCLFKSVHQKLNILIAKKVNIKPCIYTGNYTFWYKNERKKLFTSAIITKNNFIEETFVPKIGSTVDSNIYKKISSNNLPFSFMFDGGEHSLYLNMRATFWIKAFLGKHTGSEYKELRSSRKEIIYYSMCLLNSSLFWWYWICVSDCWHITRKELDHFKVPINVDNRKVKELAINLERKLEITKKFVNTTQTKYEYKHKNCINEINKIDDYINKIYGLNHEENNYIKKFSIGYRLNNKGEKFGHN